jgi:hypothetical protein
MPLAYPLLFPFGKKTEYSADDRRFKNGQEIDKAAGAMHHYSSRLHVREGEFNIVTLGRRVLQQYIVDAWVAVESFRLDYIRHNQETIRADTYKTIADQNSRDVVDGAAVGSRVILPATVRNSDRWMQQRYLDSMAIVQYYGKPTFFITFTANPQWDEVTANLELGHKWIDEPHLVARVFDIKVKAMLQDLKEGFGHRIGLVRTIEYQKRGVPHCHILLFIENGQSIFSDPELVDQVISAEIPDLDVDPDLHAVVTGMLIHGPCGKDNPGNVCMAKDKTGKLCCSKKYPKEFRAETTMREDSYPDYRRLDNGRVTTQRGVILDNRYVVPYNPFLTRRYKAHINVEMLADVNAVKYIHKYVYKGVDKATMAIKEGNKSIEQDEIQQYISGRWVGACQACWELFSFKVHEETPPVLRLAVHLPEQQSVIFNETRLADNWNEVLERAASTTLTEWFRTNAADPAARSLPYERFPTRYVWDTKTRKWTPRQRKFAIGRIQHVMPQLAELYNLSTLLGAESCKGATCFEDLRTVDGTLHATFRGAAEAQGLLPDGSEWFVFFKDVKGWILGQQLRALFVTAILGDAASSAQELWDKFAKDFCDDLKRRLQGIPGLPNEPDYYLDYGLYLVQVKLNSVQEGTKLRDLGVSEARYDWATLLGNPEILAEKYSEDEQQALFNTFEPQMNVRQRQAFDTLLERMSTHPTNCKFFLQGPGGTGKSFVYRCLCAHLRAKGKIVICVASSGIAALVLPGGSTAHSMFKIPLDTTQIRPCSVKRQSDKAALLRQVDLIIWDEVPMQHRANIGSVNLLLRDLRQSNKFFGGVPVVFGGDFAQIPPVVAKGRREQQVAASLRSDRVFRAIPVLSLTENMRLGSGQDDREYAQWLRKLPYTPSLYGYITLPSMIRQTLEIEELHKQVFPRDKLLFTDPTWLAERAILAPHNRTVEEHNRILLAQLPGEYRYFNAWTTIQGEESQANAQFYTPAFLNSLQSNSLQPARLRLKIGAPIILLRNTCPEIGMCNGTRLRVKFMTSKAIVAVILGGEFNGNIVGIARQPFTTNDGEFPFIARRHQFPVRLCFAMSINKSQGQSLGCVGVDLRSSTFTHGQLYVALSRVREVSQLTVLLRGDEESRACEKAENIVWPDLLLKQPDTTSV